MSFIIDVLIVDDEEDWRERLEELIGVGFSVSMVASAKEAFETIQKRFFYCALVDKSLIPKQGDDNGGMKVLELIKELGEGTKCLLFTAYSTTAKLSLENWQLTKVIKKENLGNLIEQNEITTEIHNMIDEAKTEYSQRYDSGLFQLVNATRGDYYQSIWETEIIEGLLNILKKHDYQIFRQFLDQLLFEVSPLIPYRSNEGPMVDPKRRAVIGRYWSKGIGKSVAVLFGREKDMLIESRFLSKRFLIRQIIHGSFRGLIIDTGLSFERFNTS